VRRLTTINIRDADQMISHDQRLPALKKEGKRRLLIPTAEDFPTNMIAFFKHHFTPQ
jgi:hypothetical protein